MYRKHVFTINKHCATTTTTTGREGFNCNTIVYMQEWSIDQWPVSTARYTCVAMGKNNNESYISGMGAKKASNTNKCLGTGTLEIIHLFNYISTYSRYII